jgi:hypothetical protein
VLVEVTAVVDGVEVFVMVEFGDVDAVLRGLEGTV